jgi:phosphoglycolate phosphatase
VDQPGKIAAFDLDGTLVNSGSQIHRSLLPVLQALCGVTISPTFVLEKLGQPINRILDSIKIPIAMQPEVVGLFRRNLESEILNGSDIYEGAIETIEMLRSRGFQIAIATTKPTYLAELVVANSHLRGLIDFVQGTDGFSPKPNPEILHRISNRLLSRVGVMFGDRTEDVMAAKSYSTFAVGIAQSTHTMPVLLDSGADRAFLSFDDLLKNSFVDEFLD